MSAELSFVLSQYTRVTDGQTDRRTDGRTDGFIVAIIHACIAVARKNDNLGIYGGNFPLPIPVTLSVGGNIYAGAFNSVEASVRKRRV